MISTCTNSFTHFLLLKSSVLATLKWPTCQNMRRWSRQLCKDLYLWCLKIKRVCAPCQTTFMSTKLTYICNRHWDKMLTFNQTQAKSNDKTNWNYEMNCLLLLPLLPDPNYLVLVLYSRLSSPFCQSTRTRNTLAAEKAPFIRALAKQVVSLLYVFGHLSSLQRPCMVPLGSSAFL